MLSNFGSGLTKIYPLKRISLQGFLALGFQKNWFSSSPESLSEIKSLDTQSRSSLSRLLEQDPTNPRYKSKNSNNQE